MEADGEHKGSANTMGIETDLSSSFGSIRIRDLVLWQAGLMVLQVVAGVVTIVAIEFWQDLSGSELPMEIYDYLHLRLALILYGTLGLVMLKVALGRRGISGARLWGPQNEEWRAYLDTVLLALAIHGLVWSAGWLQEGETPGGPVAGMPAEISLLAGLIAYGGLAAVLEETFYRGVLYPVLRTRMSAWASVLVSDLLFVLVHGHVLVRPVDATFIAVSGLISAIIMEKARSLRLCIVFHATLNVCAVLSPWLVRGG